MKVAIQSDDQEVRDLLALMASDLEVELGEPGIPLEVMGTSEESRIFITYDGQKGVITYREKVHLARAFGLFIQFLRENAAPFEWEEQPQFRTNGVMLDVSRNAVLRVDAVKKLLRMLALMGMNAVMLYTEDTYTISGRPYFGYMRGRYTEDELRECDDYAAALGIELIPCIQTLGHLKLALQWDYASAMKDADDVLLADDEATYAFIEDMIQAASKPLRTKRIHIGMDEAYQVGRGVHLDKHGFENRFDLMNRHLKRVLDITDRQRLEPMIWSDMFFGSSFLEEHDGPGAILQEDHLAHLPKQVKYVYWDYFHEDEGVYERCIQTHKKLGTLPVFAGGVWTWAGLAPNYGKTFATTNAALQACKKEGVEEVFATLWGDNGAETSVFAGLLGMQLFAEHGFHAEVDGDWLSRRFKLCTGGDAVQFRALSKLDETPGVEEGNLNASNPSKFLLWQDTLIGLFDHHVEGLPMNTHYEKLSEELAGYAGGSGKWGTLFLFYQRLSEVLALKSELGLELKRAYDSKDTEELRRLAEGKIPELAARVEKLKDAHRSLWFANCKAFGWEVLDIRYGGVLSRLQTAAFRIGEYVNGKVDRLEELEAERLDYMERQTGSLGTERMYHRIATAGNLSG
ncbi:beta-N-acetylhexosaminidase [Gorillibacterium massiliense]|uniref:beta-N-acetylhexosaminidase n=1 Tax=Gorillibacterium massiliense TaxID=1280390 RepID=UPI0004BB0307|nr:beta-N-acetylhexosaminidase [Gorillibacterium massiliense]